MTIELKQMLDIDDLAKIDRAMPLATMPEPSIGANCLPVLGLILAVNTAKPLIINVTSNVAPKAI